ncbi:hypothetical protein SLEP1_g48686 [Rubroshorea leprosula]|uniref:Uncharacterized protein n=1 Tax=Rubroshorea leprosula TaxID=152421 RepID=A0AAV5LXF8_9ROSI|nr:hypothetical protein SLEP1_g48686 [Rubroshorea leprosula]
MAVRKRSLSWFTTKEIYAGLGKGWSPLLSKLRFMSFIGMVSLVYSQLSLSTICCDSLRKLTVVRKRSHSWFTTKEIYALSWKGMDSLTQPPPGSSLS